MRLQRVRHNLMTQQQQAVLEVVVMTIINLKVNRL